jgi:hypothetical protein
MRPPLPPPTTPDELLADLVGRMLGEAIARHRAETWPPPALFGRRHDDPQPTDPTEGGPTP